MRQVIAGCFTCLLSAGCAAGAGDSAGGDSGLESDDTGAVEGALRHLVSPGGWAQADAEDDPFAHERPDEIVCPEWGYGEEEATFEVETDLCGWGAFSQPIAEGFAAGETLTADLWYRDLWAEAPAEAHLAVGVGEQTIFEAWIEIPSSAAVVQIEVPAAAAAPAGTAAWFHVHNHGANSYRLVSITAGDDRGSDTR